MLRLPLRPLLLLLTRVLGRMRRVDLHLLLLLLLKELHLLLLLHSHLLIVHPQLLQRPLLHSVAS